LLTRFVSGKESVNSGVSLRVLRSEVELQDVREAWSSWQRHPNADLEFFLTIARIRPDVISPYVIALYRNQALETLLVGRIEHGHLPLSLGYWSLFRFPVRSLTFIYGGLLGNASDENCAALMQKVKECLNEEKAQLTSLHFMAVGSAMHRAATSGSLVCRDYFAESRPHWVMRLPTDVAKIYENMSPKARRNRRYEASRLLKSFPEGVRVACYSNEADLDRVLVEAESIACKTYQRGLGVGFVANVENLERFRVEARRGRFRAYLLYFGDKPVAFFLGTLNKNILYDNFTAYDPEYSKHSPGTYLFFQLFDRLCREGVESVDFGFGDAWYKAQFGTQKTEEATVALFAPRIDGVALNMVRIPVIMLDRIGKKAVENLSVLRAVKKKWRDRAQKRASS
jgi:GNAT acetyltransferase-like protein